MTEEDQQSTDGNTPAPETRSAGGSPEERVTALEAEKLELRDRMLRIAAEFENWKKRSRREQSEAESKGKEVVLRDMLEVADNLERALAAATGADPSIQQGVQLVLRMFQNKLERHDVKPIEAKGTPFDPRMHDAISQVPTSEVPPGTVISELQKGYKIGDRLLRPATVVVGIAPPASAGPNGEGRGGGEGGEGS
jgi:molecular chaperone GrpE